MAHPDEALYGSLCRLLAVAGIRNLRSVNSVRAALDILTQHPIDVLLTGTQLTDSDGWRLIRLIRSGRFVSSGLPVIVLSSNDGSPLEEALADEHQATLVNVELLAELPERLLRAHTAENTDKPGVLIIEDDTRAARLAQLCLQNHYAVELAADGQAGLTAWRTRRHALVLLDVMLPLLAGPEVLKAIIQEDPRQAVVIITAYPNRERHQELVLEGAMEFIAKPFDINQLRQLCARVLRVSSYINKQATWQKASNTGQVIDQRLRMAGYYLDSGRPALAAYHINQALALRGTLAADDEWLQFLDESE